MVKTWQDLLKSEVIASYGELSIESKTIFMLAGLSLAGKTITCLHLVNEAIKKKQKVLYVDTEEKSILTRPHPNLFKDFYEKNKKLYDSYFIYIDRFKEKEFFQLLDEKKPKLVVIDSVYQPFFKLYNESRTRAKKIKDFLTDLRSYVWENNIGCIITTPVGRVVEPLTKEERLVPLGGESIKYLSDIKILIQFITKDDKDSETPDRRLFVIDRQLKIAFKIEYGGYLIPIKNTS